MMSLGLYAVLLAFLTGTLAIILVRDWRDSQDVLYPTMFAMPMLFVLHVIFPLHLWSESEAMFLYYGGSAAQHCWYAIQTIAIAITFSTGVRSGAGHVREHSVTRPAAHGPNGLLYAAGVSLGLVGCIVFGGAVAEAGGFAAVYGSSYAGVYIENGWVSELRSIGIAAVPLVMLSRRQLGMRAVDWIVVVMAISPLLAQGLLGARRGPTFLAVAICAAGYVAIFRPRIRPVYFLAGGALLGFFLLFLVSNRDTIYVGSNEVGTRSVSSALVDFKGNEYMYGLAFMRYIDSGVAPYYGRRVLGHLLGRIAPKSMFPDAYTDIAEAFAMPDVDYRLNAGAPLRRMETVLGYASPNGAAPGIVGELYLEFGAYLSLVIAFLIGALHGRFWRKSCEGSELRYVATYLLLVALGIYLMTQSLEAWLYRALLLGVPLWYLTRLLDRAAARRTRRIAEAMASPTLGRPWQ